MIRHERAAAAIIEILREAGDVGIAPLCRDEIESALEKEFPEPEPKTIAAQALAFVAQHKEELIKAFLAKTGLQPDQCELAERWEADGVKVTHVRRVEPEPPFLTAEHGRMLEEMEKHPGALGVVLKRPKGCADWLAQLITSDNIITGMHPTAAAAVEAAYARFKEMYTQ